jgi:FkbM family methyltransferase
MALRRILQAACRGRGFRRSTRLLGRLLGRDGYATFDVFGSRCVRVGLADPYWVAPVLQHGRYEPAVHHLLEHLLTEDATFLDCGANIGWWSVFASTRIRRPERIVALEASPATHLRLCINAQLNGGAFVPVNAAVWNRTGDTVAMRVTSHSTPSVVPGSAEPTDELVTTITLDDLVEQRGLQTDPVVLKLDVEGAERMALLGARRLLRREALVVYEDHGLDTQCEATRTLLDAGLAVFFCDERRHVRPVAGLEDARALKERRDVAYTFAGCSPGGVFHQRLRGLIDRAA